ncbi:MAG: DUF3048 domain-containing protein [Acidimicrobiia bacterium]|nr:DUF3048 domain-containing protein [Acidimicrobiia bacterium]
MGEKRAVFSLMLSLALGAGLLPATTAAAETIDRDQVVLVEPSGRWHLRVPGSVDYTFWFGMPGDIPLLGDWDGDGIDTPGVYRPSRGSAHLTNEIPAYLSANRAAGTTFFFGMPGDRVFTGDWDGDGIDTLGLSRRGRVFLTNTNATTVADEDFWFGTHLDIPYAGDPDGNGLDGMLLHRTSSASVFYANDITRSLVAETAGVFYFGTFGDELVIGDWDGDGVDSPGVFRPSDATVHTRDLVDTGTATTSYRFGRAGWNAVAGNTHLHIGPTIPLAPLTGLPGGDASQRVVIAKFSNSSKARPQAGINQADLVMEVIVEWGVGRWIALYQTDHPDIVGPLRSVREVDPKLIEPFDARVLHSGGQPLVRQAIAEVGVDEGNGRIPGYFREAGRTPVYDLMYDFDSLPADDWVGAVAPVLTFDPWLPAGGVRATAIDLAMSPPNVLAWQYDGGEYARYQSGTQSLDAGGAAITADSVVVAFVEQIDTGRFDSAGGAVPDYVVTGTGEAVVFRNGRAFAGYWERAGTDEFFRFFQPNGQEITMDPGRTWIHVTPQTGTLDWR